MSVTACVNHTFLVILMETFAAAPYYEHTIIYIKAAFIHSEWEQFRWTQWGISWLTHTHTRSLCFHNLNYFAFGLHILTQNVNFNLSVLI